MSSDEAIPWSQNGRTPLHFAAMNGNHPSALDCGVYLLENENTVANVPDRDGRTPLHLVCITGNYELFKRIFSRAPEMSAADVWGNTPLHYAAKNGHAHLLRFALASCGADIAVADRTGNSAMHLAARHGHAEAARKLLRAGMDPDAAVARGWTALHFAAREGNLAVASCLLEHGANPNHKSAAGRTPLHVACEFFRADVVEVLLRWGAKASEVTNDGETCVEMVSTCADAALRERVALMLVAMGAEPLEGQDLAGLKSECRRWDEVFSDRTLQAARTAAAEARAIQKKEYPQEESWHTPCMRRSLVSSVLRAVPGAPEVAIHCAAEEADGEHDRAQVLRDRFKVSAALTCYAAARVQ